MAEETIYSKIIREIESEILYQELVTARNIKLEHQSILIIPNKLIPTINDVELKMKSRWGVFAVARNLAKEAGSMKMVTD